MGYKFAFDLGSTSCGWAVVKVDENNNIISFEDMGVRIFPDGRDNKSLEPLCVHRRDMRGARKRHDRILIRKSFLCSLLKENSMDFSNNDERKNPYELRAKAVTDKLSLPELGRVLFNLSLRRGFKSNRKEIKKDNKEGTGTLSDATRKLEGALNGKTLGQFLYERYKINNENGIKTRFSEQFDGNKLKEDSLYPTRAMYENEFETIWEKQVGFYPSVLTEELKGKLYNAIFIQRPLKPQERGKCIFEDDKYRIYKAHPLFQKFRVLQTINQLEIIVGNKSEKLSEEQKNLLKEILLKTFDGVSNAKSKLGEITFSELRKKLKLGRDVKFNLENEKRNSIQSNITSFLMSSDKCFGQKWFEISDDEKYKIIDMILDDEIEEAVIVDYLKNTYELFDENIENIILSPLEDGTGSLSKEAILKLLPYLEEWELYSDACEKVYGSHSDIDSDIEMDRLPYYGEVLGKSCLPVKEGQGNKDEQKFGRITNVSVHIALNQLRQVVNALIDKYGKPQLVSIEVARDLKVGTKGLKEINDEQAKNKKENDKICDELKSAFGIQHPSREDIQKYKLWKELGDKDIDRCCVYTGKQIGANELFSPLVQIEHILPFSRTLDDSMANKTLSYNEANYYKKERTPFEAFSDNSDSRFNWEEILERANKLSFNKKWRFSENAMEKYNKDGGPIARALNDTRYMTKSAISYLKVLFDREHKKNSVIGLPGQMTSLMREVWGLNWYKNKDDADLYRASHIHHAIDAFTVACMTRGELQKLSTNADKIERESENYKDIKSYRKKLMQDNSNPFEGFDRHSFIEKCENMVISYRPKLKNPKDTKNTVGALCEDTAYSLLDFEKNKKEQYLNTKAFFVCREFAKLKKNDRDSGLIEKDFKNIHEKTLEMFNKKIPNGTFEQFLEYCKDNNIKKVKLYSSAKDISTYVPVFRTKQERDDYHKAYEKWYVCQGQSPDDDTKDKKKIRKEKEAELLSDLQEQAKKAYKWFVGGNNFCADIYQINPNDKIYTKERGDWKVEIISNYMATINKGEPLWRKKYKTARRVMQLKINDMVKAEFKKDDASLPSGIKDLVISNCIKNHSDEVSIIFRVKKIDMIHDRVFLRPDFITKEEADTKSWGATASSMIKYKARKVYVSPIGDVVDNGFDTKWSIKNDT